MASKGFRLQKSDLGVRRHRHAHRSQLQMQAPGAPGLPIMYTGLEMHSPDSAHWPQCGSMSLRIVNTA